MAGKRVLLALLPWRKRPIRLALPIRVHPKQSDLLRGVIGEGD